jgi:hypothetical protein
LGLETDMGRAVNDVVGAINDNLAISLSSVLRSEMKLSDDQIKRVIAIAASSVESVSYNGVHQYVTVANKHIDASKSRNSHGSIEVDTAVKKTGLFGR